MSSQFPAEPTKCGAGKCSGSDASARECRYLAEGVPPGILIWIEPVSGIGIKVALNPLHIWTKSNPVFAIRNCVRAPCEL